MGFIFNKKENGEQKASHFLGTQFNRKYATLQIFKFALLYYI